MTNFDIEDNIDEVDSTHATTATDDIHYIEMSNEWTQWRDDLGEEMFTDWELRNHMTSSLRLPKHSWTKEEEAGLVECLVELVNAGGWRFDNGTFRPGYLNQLERMMTFKILDCNIHASPNDSRIKLMKRMFHALAEMRGPTCSGFGWNDEQKCIVAEKEVFNDWIKSFADVGSNDPAGYDAFLADAAPDMDFPPMYNQGLNMSSDDLMGTRTAWVREHRNVSSGSKRKRAGHSADSGDIIRTLIEYENEQLNHIAEWPALQRQDASETRQEVVRQLEAIPELTLMDRCRLMRILMRNVDDMKAFLDVPNNMKYPYCSIILQENQ
ncbi:retrotransposon protein [Cucumis melo var. makuwa]|uniref:Retrotransposon protein n=1 Tax=Cucumis melo var. makuwa TaxID=1194695 RepID=A0A5A7TDD6_CUCMM|nr:retrotransposon protein [Cucumis melo var. makuwa]TYK24318.1 retrotransposon protein [Cucumis melo var. makuwa]